VDLDVAARQSAAITLLRSSSKLIVTSSFSCSKHPLASATWTGAKPSQVGARMRIWSAAKAFVEDTIRAIAVVSPSVLFMLFPFSEFEAASCIFTLE